jgi:hypothetical protein
MRFGPCPVDVIFRAWFDDHAGLAEQAGRAWVEQQLVSLPVDGVVERDRERWAAKSVVGEACAGHLTTGRERSVVDPSETIATRARRLGRSSRT